MKLMTKREVAASLAVSLRTVDNLIADGRLAVVRPGGLDVVRIEPRAVERLIAKARTTKVA